MALRLTPVLIAVIFVQWCAHANELPQISDNRAAPPTGSEVVWENISVNAERVGGLVAPKSVRMVQCELTDSAAKRLCELKSLRNLQVSGADLPAAFWENASQLQGLESLSLSLKAFDDAKFTAIGKISRLHALTLGGGREKLTQEGFKQVARLSELQSLSLGLRIDPDSIAALRTAVKLNHITLDRPELNSKLNQSIASLTQLRSLEIFGARLSDRDLTVLLSAHQIVELSLDCCDLDGKAVPVLFGNPHLKSLKLHRTECKGEKFQPSGMLERLGIDSSVAPTIVRQIADASTLTHLDLSGVHEKVAEEILSFYSLHRLKALSFQDSAMNDAVCQNLKAFQFLEELDLSGTEVTVSGVEIIRQFPNLRRLILLPSNVNESDVQRIRSPSEPATAAQHSKPEK
jgi:hypothetical protein